MNGNDYIEIIEANEERIIETYIESIRTIDDVEEEFINEWVEQYLEYGNEEE